MRRRGELSLTLLGIAFAVAATFILFSLKLGIEQSLFEAAERKNPLSQITVYGESGTLLKFLGAGRQKNLNPETLETFKKIPEVKSASPHMVYQNFASVELEILGQVLQTDSLVFGMDIEGSGIWEQGTVQGIVPVLISRKLIDLYNLSLAPGVGLPALSEETFKGKDIKILPGYSSFFPNRSEAKKILQGRIIGFSDRVDLIGITVPIDVVRKLNREDGLEKVAPSGGINDLASLRLGLEETYNKVFLDLNSPRSVESVTKKLEEEGYRVTSLQREFKEVGRSLQYVEIILFILSGIILATSLLLVGNSFWASLTSRTQELGILRAIGATKGKLTTIFLLEAAFAGIFGGALGLLLGIGAIQIFQKILGSSFYLASVSLETIFSFSPTLLVSLLIASPVLSVIASFIPIIKTFNQPPRALFIK